MIFNLDPVSSTESQYQLIRHGISNWRSVWNRRVFTCHHDLGPLDDARIGSDPDHQVITLPETSPGHNEKATWRRSGFWKHAAEFWLLSRIFLDRASAARHYGHRCVKPTQLDSLSTASLQNRSSTLPAENGVGHEPDHMVGKNDEEDADTNLLQLHGFIRSFQGLST
jgi:hypothetical protein